MAVTVMMSGIFRILKQPLIIGYIVAGIVVSPFLLDIIHSIEIINVFAKIGVAFLLFIIGMSLSPKVIKEVGKTSVITGIGQIVFTSVIGFVIAKLLGFSDIVAAYIAIAMTFSSTIIIMKLLSDKNDAEKLYGKISIGFLLVQDVFVILLLILVPFMAQNLSLKEFDLTSIAVNIVLVAVLILASLYIFPKISRIISRSTEFLFLFAVSWGLGMAALFDYLGLSMEIGALIAGIAFSVTPHRFEISSKMKPLRDFFLVMFFVLLGSQMVPEDIEPIIIPAMIFSVFVLVGNPIIVMMLMGLMGYKKKTGFKAGLTVAQISEFSIIFVALGIQVGHLSDEILSLVTIVGIITIGGSTYMILYSDRLYQYLSKYIGVFERKKIRKYNATQEGPEVLLFGCGRMGSVFLQTFERLHMRTLVVDHDPRIIEYLEKRGITYLFKDAEDLDLREIDLSQTNILVSTICDMDTNTLLTKRMQQYDDKTAVIVIANTTKDAKDLYSFGATFVVIPYHLGADYACRIIEDNGADYQSLVEEGKKHTEELKDV
ncbi:cation:proton antiporter [Nitrosopumilus sp.]|uniref:cation:proton antiporter n=1 Tax=Nitrosopumilus sp. TaxID=2024843 RepID=UPI00349FF0F4